MDRDALWESPKPKAEASYEIGKCRLELENVGLMGIAKAPKNR